VSKVWVIAAVPAASRDVVEAEISRTNGAGDPVYLLSPNEPGQYTFSVPLSTDGSLPATHYGTCAAVPSDGLMAAALPSLVAAFPGSSYHTVDVGNYDRQRDWIDWLAGLGLEPVTAPPPG